MANPAFGRSRTKAACWRSTDEVPIIRADESRLSSYLLALLRRAYPLLRGEIVKVRTTFEEQSSTALSDSILCIDRLSEADVVRARLANDKNMLPALLAHAGRSIGSISSDMSLINSLLLQHSELFLAIPNDVRIAAFVRVLELVRPEADRMLHGQNPHENQPVSRPDDALLGSYSVTLLRRSFVLLRREIMKISTAEYSDLSSIVECVGCLFHLTDAKVVRRRLANDRKLLLALLTGAARNVSDMISWMPLIKSILMEHSRSFLDIPREQREAVFLSLLDLAKREGWQYTGTRTSTGSNLWGYTARRRKMLLCLRSA